MARWEPDSQGRLVEAAVVLFEEHGFDQTTVADIAERAGLTERTFFRHFSDKREVLFFGASALEELLVVTTVTAPAAATPIESVTLALEAAGDLFSERREFSLRRQRIISSSTELQERELIKLASLATSLDGALRQRGVPDPMAGLTGEIAIAVFKIAFERWVTEPNPPDLARVIRESFSQLRAVTSTP
jgi:AcrR family transcriptional regulator